MNNPRTNRSHQRLRSYGKETESHEDGRIK